ncbi:MAG: ArsR/SmtB family transcription factor [Shimia sp.]
MDPAPLFAALGDPMRLALIDRLRGGARPVGVLAEGLPISRPAVSQHLRVLSEAGLVDCRAAGRHRLYRLSPAALAALRDYTDRLWDDALAAFAARAAMLAEDAAREAAMTTDPIVKTLDVDLPPDAAFDLFATRMGEWWPTDTHSLSAEDGARPHAVEVEPREGGRILDTTHDGRIAPWGRVTAWEPGRRFAAAWHVGRPEAEATMLDVRFDARGGGTRVTLIHDGWEVLGAAGAALRGGYHGGWDRVLGQCYGGACAAALQRA